MGADQVLVCPGCEGADVDFVDLGAEHARTPLYTLDVVAARRPPRRRDRLEGLGDFRDLRQLLLFEVAR